MSRHGLALSKADTARFISRLDLICTFQRSFLRAGIAIKYTEGFNPHAFVLIPLLLSVGFSSGCKVLECQVLGTPLDQVPIKMNAALPAGTTTQRRYEAVQPIKKLCYVSYIAALEHKARTPFDVESAIRDLLARDYLVIIKRSKKAKSGFIETDLIPLIARATVEERRNIIAPDLVLRAQNPGLNPELVVAAIREYCPDAAPDSVIFHRRMMLDGQFQIRE